MNIHTKAILNNINVKLRSDIIFTINTTTVYARRVPDSSTGLSLPAVALTKDDGEVGELRGSVTDSVDVSMSRYSRSSTEDRDGSHVRKAGFRVLPQGTPIGILVSSGFGDSVDDVVETIEGIEDLGSDDEVIIFRGRTRQ